MPEVLEGGGNRTVWLREPKAPESTLKAYLNLTSELFALRKK